jgi:D-alanyl-D-alanine carboxypeptidase
MKQFFYILFGGLTAVGCGIIMAYGVTLAWNTAAPHIGLGSSLLSFSRATSVIAEDASANTFVTGLKRRVRFSAHEEEDSINTSISLPQPQGDKITATAYIVRNLTDGSVVAEHNIDKSIPVASLTKLVTAVVARRLIDSNQRITITEDIISAYGNTAGFKTGETFQADDLLYPLLMVSSNDAAEAFARAHGRTRFIKAMNDFTQEIGAYRTYFDDPSGLSPHNMSSVSDLALLIAWIQKNDPRIIEVTNLKSKTVRVHTWTNPTHFLNWSYYIGGKNGYIPESERTTVSLFKMGLAQNTYAVAVLGSLSRDEDVMKLLAKIK